MKKKKSKRSIERVIFDVNPLELELLRMAREADKEKKRRKD